MQALLARKHAAAATANIHYPSAHAVRAHAHHQRHTHTVHGVVAAHHQLRDAEPRPVASSFDSPQSSPLFHHAGAADATADVREHRLAEHIETAERTSALASRIYADAIVNRRAVPVELVFVRGSPPIASILDVQ